MNIPSPLTRAQEAYIREHYMSMFHREIAAELGIKEAQVAYFCRMNNLRKTKPKPFKKKYRREMIPAPVKIGNHWPADHHNVSREQHVDRILNMPL